MASNFGIAVDKNSDGFGLKLAGDFDATSAYELIYAIKKLPEDTVKIYIHTNGLKNIHPSGLNVFHRCMSALNGQSTKIVFTGNCASQLSLGNSFMTSISHCDPLLKISQINVTTTNGVVGLSGTVDSQQSIDRATEIARSVENVKSAESGLVR